jgi:hypothetical protein
MDDSDKIFDLLEFYQIIGLDFEVTNLEVQCLNQKSRPKDGSLIKSNRLITSFFSLSSVLLL